MVISSVLAAALRGHSTGVAALHPPLPRGGGGGGGEGGKRSGRPTSPSRPAALKEVPMYSSERGATRLAPDPTSRKEALSGAVGDPDVLDLGRLAEELLS